MKPIDIARIEVCRAKQRFLTRKEAAMVIKAQRERRNPAPGKIEPLLSSQYIAKIRPHWCRLDLQPTPRAWRRTRSKAGMRIAISSAIIA